MGKLGWKEDSLVGLVGIVGGHFEVDFQRNEDLVGRTHQASLEQAVLGTAGPLDQDYQHWSQEDILLVEQDMQQAGRDNQLVGWGRLLVDQCIQLVDQGTQLVGSDIQLGALLPE